MKRVYANKTDVKVNTFSVFQHQITMTQYKKEFPFPVMFPPVTPKNVLAEWLSVQSVPQFHCAGRCGFENSTSSVPNIIRRQRGRVVRAPDLKSVGRGFKSRSER